MKIHLKTLIVAVALAALMFTSGLPINQSRCWVDPVTGSVKSQESFVIFPMSTVVRQSELERWIIRHEGAYKPQWEHLSTVTQSLSGRTHACSLGPPIYQLHEGRSNSEFLRRSTDEEIAKFVHVMRTGTRGEQEQAVNAAIEKVL